MKKKRNYWKNVEPDPREHCGPYYNQNGTVSSITNERRVFLDSIKKENRKLFSSNFYNSNKKVSKNQQMDYHKSIAIIAMDQNKDFAAGTSSNGIDFEVSGSFNFFIFYFLFFIFLFFIFYFLFFIFFLFKLFLNLF